jgi:MFS family permease
VIHGVGNSAQNTAIGTIISDVVPRDKLSRGIGYNGIVGTIATAIGPVLGLYLVKKFSFGMLFNVSLVFVVVSFSFSLLMKYERKNIDTSSNLKVEKRQVSKGAVFEKTAFLPSLFIFAIGVTYPSIFTFLTPYALSMGIENIGIFFSIYAVAYLVGRLVSDWITSRFSLSKAIVVGFLAIASAYVQLIIAGTLLTFLIAGALCGFGFSIIQPSLNAIALSFCPDDRRGAANATYFSAMDISYGGGAIVLGLIAQHTSLPQIFLGSAIFTLLSLAVYMATLHRKLERDVEESIGEIV